jgi:hypothetical protein
VKGKEALVQLYEELVGEGKSKFLGVFEEKNLEFMERLLSANLGVGSRLKVGKQPRHRRPFIGLHEKESLLIYFLTSKRKSLYVNLGPCYRESRCKWILDHSYLLENENASFAAYAVKKVLLKDRYIFCGRCDDLDYLDDVGVIEV